MKNKFFFLLIILSFLVVSAILAGVFFGSVPLNPFDLSSSALFIIWQLRLPRVLLAALAGAMLSVSGALLQSSLRNPLCDPYILGVSAGGGLGAALAIISGMPIFLVSVFAFIGALLAVLAVYQLSKVSGEVKPQTLILAGVAVSSFLGALLMYFIVYSDKLQSVYFWMLGSFSGANYDQVKLAAVCAAFGIIFSWLFSNHLNVLSFKDEEALSLGVNVDAARIIFLAVSSLMAGVSVSMCGMIGFVGLIIPHVIRLLIGSNNTYLVPLSALLGAVYLVAADLISRTVLIPAEIPVGIITALIGSPFFIYLLRKKR